MKMTRFASLVVLGLTLTFTVIGCKKNPYGVTNITNPALAHPSDNPEMPLINPENSMGTNDETFVGIPAGPGHPNWTKDPSAFAKDTVRFDYDSSSLKASEKSKVANVADFLKSNLANAVEVEGHCDERGTEEYNRSLGERRALALREELVRLGIEPNRVDTISFGEDRPADSGHEQSAWAKNRRGEFILLAPPQ
jgi:peptidoglycan-associated lipoprotein